MVTVGIVNVIAAVVFAAALCWRLEQIRREGGGLQPLAMTMAIATLTLAFIASGDDVADAIDTVLFTGADRVIFYALLAIGVAALIIVFFFPGRSTTRERRAGLEAIPLVAAIVGLQVTMLVIPPGLRTAQLSDWTVRNVAYAVFVLIASGYLAYGFIACVRSIRRFFELADGYLRLSLGLLLFGLGLLAVSSLSQIVYVLGTSMDLFQIGWLLTVSQVLSIVGVVAFLLGVSYPMLHARWHSLKAGRRRRRDAADLLPLWELVTSGVPEVVLTSTGPVSVTMRLHRRVVEIRDALTQLSPCLPADFDSAPDADRVEMVRDAVAEYVAGRRSGGGVRDVLPGDGADLDADAKPLLELSKAMAAQDVPAAA
ncbi:MAB_1171c family putative transporter [Gordonia sp. CPCC 206044]|uniref:MAB_1171c family putative transporter n=1 Tax=Gordonia sp. CPCC 206044 TaxID=3140793 RepID=UPI003AF39327